MSQELLVHGIEVGLAGFPNNVEWFETDDALRAYLAGNQDAPRRVAYRDSLTVPADVWSAHAIEARCQQISRAHGCELIANRDGSRTFLRGTGLDDLIRLRDNVARIGTNYRSLP